MSGTAALPIEYQLGIVVCMTCWEVVGQANCHLGLMTCMHGSKATSLAECLVRNPICVATFVGAIITVNPRSVLLATKSLLEKCLTEVVNK